MGAWGFKVEDNDMAQDFILDYEHFIEQGKNCREAIKELISNEYMYSNEAILMAAELEYEKYGDIEDKEKVEEVLIEEISKEKLSDWGDQEERKSELLKFAKRVGVL